MRKPGKIVVLITTSGKEEAHSIADLLLNQRKIACVSIVPEVDSLFWWQGNLDSAQKKTASHQNQGISASRNC